MKRRISTTIKQSKAKREKKSARSTEQEKSKRQRMIRTGAKKYDGFFRVLFHTYTNVHKQIVYFFLYLISTLVHSAVCVCVFVLVFSSSEFIFFLVLVQTLLFIAHIMQRPSPFILIIFIGRVNDRLVSILFSPRQPHTHQHQHQSVSCVCFAYMRWHGALLQQSK